jgi:hypothetical protein
VLAARGGWNHWQHLSKLTANASVGGVLWAVKRKGLNSRQPGSRSILLTAVRHFHLIGTTQHLYAKPNDNRDDRWKDY